MRTSTLLLAAATAAIGMGSAYGQVFSDNVVGYINLQLNKGLNLIGNQLDNKNGNKIQDVIPTAPDGTLLYKYNGSGYNTYTYFGSWDILDGTLAPGEGAFVLAPDDSTDAQRKLTLVGEVTQGAASNGNPVNHGLQIMSSKVPQAGKLGADLKFPLTDGKMDGVIVYQFHLLPTKGYSLFTIFSGAFDVDPDIAVGEAFFVLQDNPDSVPWDRNFQVQ